MSYVSVHVPALLSDCLLRRDLPFNTVRHSLFISNDTEVYDFVYDFHVCQGYKDLTGTSEVQRLHVSCSCISPTCLVIIYAVT